jgi:serine protease AprX
LSPKAHTQGLLGGLVGGLVAVVGGVIGTVLGLLNAVVANLTGTQIRQLANDPNVKYICADRTVRANLELTGAATGAYAVQQGSVNRICYTGAGVTVAVLGSGAGPHSDLLVAGSLLRTSRVVAFVDLVNGRTQPYDDYGHGTHVAGAIAGNGSASGGRFRGMAPRANLVVIKVLDQNGAGTMSGIINGLSWCVQN